MIKVIKQPNQLSQIEVLLEAQFLPDLNLELDFV